MRLQSHYAGGRLVNHTVFGRKLRRAAGIALDSHLDRYDFGFQDGGCAMFARALVIWSGDRLALAGYATRPRVFEHVVAVDQDVVLDSDGLATVTEGARKLAVIERCYGCSLVEGYQPTCAPRIPWSERASNDLAAILRPMLPDPGSLPWRLQA
jgi:hypothetical protein